MSDAPAELRGWSVNDFRLALTVAARKRSRPIEETIANQLLCSVNEAKRLIAKYGRDDKDA